jgi:pimeloyl-ACP methyl ester carboxylesterase
MIRHVTIALARLIPTLLLSGERDAVFPPAAQRSLRPRLPRARSVTY